MGLGDLDGARDHRRLKILAVLLPLTLVASSLALRAQEPATTRTEPHAQPMPVEFQGQARQSVAEYEPRLRRLVRTEDPKLNALVERIYRECVYGKLFDPMPPELPYRWFAAGVDAAETEAPVAKGAVAQAAGVDEAASFKIVDTEEGVEVRDEERLVLFYQRKPKALEGRYARNNYIHPLMSLDGDVLTEDFPEDHLHQRGIFWAWHQLWAGEERLGDGWTLEDFVTDVRELETNVTNEAARIEATVQWRSPRFRNLEPFVEERTTITVHPVAADARAIDFRIALRARVPGVRIGGSEDAKGYGGFSARFRMPDGLVFTATGGKVTPENLQVDVGPWVDLSAPYGQDGGTSGITILTHPSNPGFPQPWILRQTNSMQNPVFPGREAVELPTERPLVLRYRLVVHRGRPQVEAIKEWQSELSRP